MAALGACVVGIGTYAQGATRLGDLQFAVADADAIETYLRTCWPGNQAEITRLDAASAMPTAFASAMTGLAVAGPFELFVLYFSGHGVASTDQIGLMLQSDAGGAGHAVVAPEVLDRLLGAIRADRTICIFDCCFAEAIVRPMTFFRGLGADQARLFVASSRADQRTWEDEKAGHGIFSAFLLDLLNTGDVAGLAGVREKLDVDSELFPLLCEQVPLFVLERKGQKQEPVKGGVSINRVSLPVARFARRMRNSTPLQTALRRLRQLLVAGVVGAIVFLGLAYELAYYPEQDKAGHVVLYHGTRWLAPALKLLPSVRVDTGISASDLSPDEAKRHGIQAGDTWGIWGHTAEAGYRNWYDLIRPALSEEAADRDDGLMGVRRQKLSAFLPNNPVPSQIEAASRLLLDGVATRADIEAILSRVPGGEVGDTYQKNLMDFDVLDLTSDALEDYAKTIQNAASLDPAAAFPAFVGYLKICQYWVTNNSDDQRGRGTGILVRSYVADTLVSIVRARVDRGLPPLDDTMRARLHALSDQGFSSVVMPALARVTPSAGVDAKGVGAALAAFHGDMSDERQMIALGILSESLDGSDASKAVVERVYQAFRRNSPSQKSDLYRFLMQAGQRHSLPPDIIQDLLKQVRATANPSDLEFEDIDLGRVLSAGITQVPAADRPTVLHLIEAVLQQMPRVSLNAQSITLLAEQGFATPAIIRGVESQAALAGPYAPADPSAYPGGLPGMQIMSDRAVWLVALAAIGKHQQLSAKAIDILVGRGTDPNLHARIVEALAAQKGYQLPDPANATLPATLGQYPRDAAHRQLIGSVAAQQIADLPRKAFQDALSRVRGMRDRETDPEVRLALGAVLVDAALMRGQAQVPGLGLID